MRFAGQSCVVLESGEVVSESFSSSLYQGAGFLQSTLENSTRTDISPDSIHAKGYAAGLTSGGLKNFDFNSFKKIKVFLGFFPHSP